MQKIGSAFSLFHYDSLLIEVYCRDTGKDKAHRHNSIKRASTFDRPRGIVHKRPLSDIDTVIYRQSPK